MPDTAVLYPGLGIISEAVIAGEVVLLPGLGLIQTAQLGVGITEVINVSGIGRIFYQFNVSVEGLNGFVINGRAHPAQNLTPIFSEAIDYTSPTGILEMASGDLTSISVGSTGWFVLDCSSLKQISIGFSSFTDSAVIASEYSGSSSMPLILES